MTGGTGFPGPQTGADRRTGYRPALDGVRAVAVLAVMLYHGAVHWASGGFLGVDVFFVLSGYLITSLLLVEWRRWGAVDLMAFYLRRARRLLPALVLVVVAVAGWARAEVDPERLGALRADGLSALLYVANWRFVLVEESYFDQYADPSPFRHTWSLAIEEQYYLFFPLVLLLLLRSAGRRPWVLSATLGAATLASIAAMAVLHDPDGDPSRIYYGTDTRIHELLIGSLLAIALTSPRLMAGPWRERAEQFAPALAVAGLAGVLASVHLFTDASDILYLGGFALVCLAAAALIAGIELAPRAAVGRVLALGPLAWVGRISYGLYLWHWPTYIALSPTRTGLDGATLLASRIAVTFVLAGASYYLVERPVRDGLLRRLPSGWGRVVTAGALPFALVALLLGTSAAVAPRLEAQPSTTVAAPEKSRLLVVGGSVAESLAEGFPSTTYPGWELESSPDLGCLLADEPGRQEAGCEEAQQALRTASGSDPDAVLLVLGPDVTSDSGVERRGTKPDDPAFDDLAARLELLHGELTASGAPLVVTDLPCVGPEDAGPTTTRDGDDPRDAARQVVNGMLEDLADRHGDTTLVDISGRLCKDDRYRERRGGTILRYDGVHFTRPGAAQLWTSVIMPEVERVAFGESGRALRVLLVGDSVPLGLANRLPEERRGRLEVASSTLLGCSAFPAPSVSAGETLRFSEDCITWSEGIGETIDRFQPDVGVVFLGTGEQFDKQVDGEVLTFGSDRHRTWLVDATRDRIDLFRSRGIPVLLPTVPCHRVVDPGLNDVAATINDDRRVRTLNTLVEEIATGYRGVPGPEVQTFDLYDALCADGYTEQLDGVRLREDGLHFSDDGSALVWDLLAPALGAVSDSDRP